MEKLNSSELAFIENALTYFCRKESGLMEQNPDIYSKEEISGFRSSVQELINKISKIKEGEEDHGVLCNRKRIFGLCKQKN